MDDSAYADSADELLEAEQLKEKIDAIVAKYLPKKCQTIFIMSRFEGKSNDEISAELSISKKTVENQIYEALKTIRKKMKKTMGVASYTIVLF